MELSTTVDLDVWGQFPDGEIILIGRILSRNLRSRNREGFFRYDPSYLAHPKAYPLDPEHLPLTGKSFDAANSETGLHSIFADSLPDSWGAELLAQKFKFDLIDCAPAHLLLALGATGLGRLFYTKDSQKRPPSPTDNSITFDEIKIALAEAAKLEKSKGNLTEELFLLWGSGSSAGGARPKVIAKDSDTRWIAKFSSLKDDSPTLNVSLEQAGMILAKRARLIVPLVQRKTFDDKEVLLVQRFDISKQGGRYAIMSFKTLLGTNDPFSVSYGRLAEALQKHSFQPDIDLALLFRQMVVNLLILNTDDHLQNFAMIHVEEGWKLSPTYDIVPNIYQASQLLAVNGKHSGINRQDVIDTGKRFGFSKFKSEAVLDDVLSRLSRWEEVFATCNVPQQETIDLRENIKVAFSRMS